MLKRVALLSPRVPLPLVFDFPVTMGMLVAEGVRIPELYDNYK
jgi:hypothetical protein